MTAGNGSDVLSRGPSEASREPHAETERAVLDALLERLAGQARAFARLEPGRKAALLREVRQRFSELGPRMVEAANAAKRIEPSSSAAGEEWFSGPAISIRALRLFEQSLRDIAERGAPRLGLDSVSTGDQGETRVRLVPHDLKERLQFPGWRTSAWLEPEVSAAEVTATQAEFYQRRDPEGQVVLVLGAGNVGSISVLDVLYHSFAQGSVCLLKMSPVNAYLGPLYERAFAPLIARGFFAVVQGGAEVGAYLAGHPLVSAIHVTGSVETHDAIVWGPPGPERERRRREGAPLSNKKITSELGNVSPVLVLPAAYSEQELDAAARNIAGMVVFNDSFNCNAARALVTAQGWRQREQLLARLSAVLSATPTRFAYYPGAQQRYAALLDGVPEEIVSRIGERRQGKLPWTLVSPLAAGSGSALFRSEAFCPILSETPLATSDPVEFLALGTRFANEELSGTLNAMLIAPHSAFKDPLLARALDGAVRELRYGTVSLNVWPAVGYGLVSPPWGGYPGATLDNVQSGIGWGHNSLLLERVQKVVVEGSLLGFPRPFWFPGHAHLAALGKGLSDFESAPGPEPLLRAGWAAIWP